MLSWIFGSKPLDDYHFDCGSTHRDALAEKIQNGDFEAFEKTFKTLSPGERYALLGCFSNRVDSVFPQAKKWFEQGSPSDACQVFYAQCLMQKAWAVRGYGPAKYVEEEDMNAFLDMLAQVRVIADGLLEKKSPMMIDAANIAITISSALLDDPYQYVLDLFFNLLEHPDMHPGLALSWADALNPKWSGADVDAFEKIVQETIFETPEDLPVLIDKSPLFGCLMHYMNHERTGIFGASQKEVYTPEMLETLKDLETGYDRAEPGPERNLAYSLLAADYYNAGDKAKAIDLLNHKASKVICGWGWMSHFRNWKKAYKKLNII